MKKFILSILAIAAMASCTKTSEDDVDPNVPVEIKFGAGIDMLSRAAITTDGSGHPVSNITSIQILRGTDGANPAFNTISDVTTTADLKTDGTFENIINPQYYKSTTDAANFIAYWPQGLLTSGTVNFTITGEEDIIVAPAIATTYSTTPPTVNFQFAHKLAQLQLKVIAQNESAFSFYGVLERAKINVPSKLDMTIKADGSTELTANATPTNIDLDFGSVTYSTTETSASKNFIILPVAPTTINLKFANITEAKDYDIKDLALLPGKITTLTITVNATGVNFSSTITEWTTGGTDGKTNVGGN